MGENVKSDDMKVKVDVLYLGTGLSSENMRGIKIDDKKVYELREIKIRRQLEVYRDDYKVFEYKRSIRSRLYGLGAIKCHDCIVGGFGNIRRQ